MLGIAGVPLADTRTNQNYEWRDVVWHVIDTVSPRGGLVLCEDGDGTEYVHGLTTDGVIFRFIQNNVDLRTTPWNGFNSDFRGSEFAGACYSPDGKWLFVNIQSPGISFAITGPWGSGGDLAGPWALVLGPWSVLGP